MLPFSRFLALYFSPGVGKQFGFFLFSFFFRVLRAIFFPNSISREKNEIVHLDTSNSNNEKKALKTFETFEPRSDFWCGFPRLKFFPVVFIRGVFAGEAQGFEVNYIFGWAGFYAREQNREQHSFLCHLLCCCSIVTEWNSVDSVSLSIRTSVIWLAIMVITINVVKMCKPRWACSRSQWLCNFLVSMVKGYTHKSTHIQTRARKKYERVRDWIHRTQNDVLVSGLTGLG